MKHPCNLTSPWVAVCATVTVAVAVAGCALEPVSDPGDGARAQLTAPDSVPVNPPPWTITAAGPCPIGFVCLYQNANRTGVMVTMHGGVSIADFRAIPCPVCTNGTKGNDGTFDKQMSSWENRSAVSACYYDKPDGKGGKGTAHLMNRDRAEDSLGAANDVASSVDPC